MLSNLPRHKLINAVLFFSKNVKYPFKLKIFKLLFLLDFKQMKEKGYPVTNLNYYTWELGPVPRDLFNEIKSGLADDFKNSLQFKTITIKNDNDAFKVIPLKNPDMSIFTKREKRILEELVFIYKDATGEEMTEITHLKNQPWDKTIKSKGENELIDYLLAIDNESNLSPEDAAHELKQIKEMYVNHCV